MENDANNIFFEFGLSRMQIHNHDEITCHDLNKLEKFSIKSWTHDAIALRLYFSYENIIYFLKIPRVYDNEIENIKHCKFKMNELKNALISGHNQNILGFISITSDQMDEIIKENHGR